MKKILIHRNSTSIEVPAGSACTISYESKLVDSFYVNCTVLDTCYVFYGENGITVINDSRGCDISSMSAALEAIIPLKKVLLIASDYLSTTHDRLEYYVQRMQSILCLHNASDLLDSPIFYDYPTISLDGSLSEAEKLDQLLISECNPEIGLSVEDFSRSEGYEKLQLRSATNELRAIIKHEHGDTSPIDIYFSNGKFLPFVNFPTNQINLFEADFHAKRLTNDVRSAYFSFSELLSIYEFNYQPNINKRHDICTKRFFKG